MPASRALSALAARGRLGGRHLRVLVDPEPEHRARRLGHDPAQGRAHDRVRDPRRAASAGDRPGAAGARGRDRATRSRTRSTSTSSAAATHRRSTSSSTRSAWRSASSSCAVSSGHVRRLTPDRSREDGRDRARRARRHAAALARLARGCGSALSLDLAARPRRAARGPRQRRRRSSTRGRSTESATGGRALARFAEDRAPVYLRPDAEVSAALRELAARGDRLGVFTDAPEPLARIAVSQLGADRRIEALETGAGALERLLAELGPDTLVVRDRTALPLQFTSVKENELGDRQLDALLERLDRMNAELRALNRRLDSGEHLAPIVYEIRALGESLQALAYAALGQTARRSVAAERVSATQRAGRRSRSAPRRGTARRARPRRTTRARRP